MSNKHKEGRLAEAVEACEAMRQEVSRLENYIKEKCLVLNPQHLATLRTRLTYIKDLERVFLRRVEELRRED